MNDEFKFNTYDSPIQFEDKNFGKVEIIADFSCKYVLSDPNIDVESFKKDLTDTITSYTEKTIDSKQGQSFEEVNLNWNKKELLNLLNSKYQMNGIVIQEVVHNFNFTEESNKKIKDNLDEKKDDKKVQIIETDIGSKDGQNKCPKCGATDISTNVKTGKLRCNFCRAEFEPELIEGMVTDISKLTGQVMGSGAKDIVADAKDVITLKCSSCGAEVVIDTASAPQARCHWCRQTLSINQQIPNGSIPDVVLPFNVTRETAQAEIEKFVGKRKFFAHPKFREEFNTNNIMGVYFPYLLVDVNAHAKLIGEGEEQTRSYIKEVGDRKEMYYDADLYHIEREFDITINGLSIESNSERLNTSSSKQTNNIINAIMPFDIENCVKYNSNYLKGYTSERRDTNIDQLRPLVDIQSKDIARFAANDTLEQYDRGVMWSSENFNIKGQQWKSAYLPVWLYSYQEVKGDKKMLHYVAVNARTKETMGSVPIHMPKLLAISFLIEILGVLAMIFVDFDYKWAFLLAGLIYFLIMYARYRNSGARHTYERDTKTNMSNLRKVDRFLQSKKGLSNSMMDGANNRRLYGQTSSSKILKNINDIINKEGEK